MYECTQCGYTHFKVGFGWVTVKNEKGLPTIYTKPVYIAECDECGKQEIYDRKKHNNPIYVREVKKKITRVKNFFKFMVRMWRIRNEWYILTDYIKGNTITWYFSSQLSMEQIEEISGQWEIECGARIRIS